LRGKWKDPTYKENQLKLKREGRERTKSRREIITRQQSWLYSNKEGKTRNLEL
jgi:hypothetical protein